MSAGGETDGTDPAAMSGRVPGAAVHAEAELLCRLAGGQRGEALGELSDRYAARLYDLGLTVFGEREPAARLAAETIDAVAARAAEFEPDGDRSAREFIYAVARERAVEIASADPEGAVDVPEGEDLERALADVEFRAAMTGLGDEGRAVLDAILGEGLTRAEAGERLGLTVGIVEVRLRTALRAVRDELRARGVAGGRR
ncbi:sigma-70 family RNA polymerase sigma factor [Thermoleophilia bacterium SCSIO 60948]|nr:sigma-70 family RNA polymerase sigma factor [Thermoleophilia bacterium SCSIO 60948]